MSVAPPVRDSALVGGLLELAAATVPDQVALVFGEARWSYAELLDETRRLATGLEAHGVGLGDRVAIVLPNAPEFVTTFFAASMLGATIVPLHHRLKEAELRFSVVEAGVRIVVTEASTAALARRVARDVGGALKVVTIEDDSRSDLVYAALVEDRDPHPGAQVGAGLTCLYQYSAGSTGRAKGVPRTHEQLVAEANAIVGGLGLHSSDSIFCDIPLFHTYGLGCCLLAAVRSGATLVIPDVRQPFPLRRARTLELLEQSGVTVFPTVPLVLRLLAETRRKTDLSSLRYCFSAGTALPVSTFRAFRDRYGIDVRQLYGTTETGALTANLDSDPDATATFVGRPLDGVEIDIVDDDGVAVLPGRIGEILVRSPAMSLGYRNAADDNRLSFDNGRYRTGDRGRFDDEGRLMITGRRKLLIDAVGEKVDPIEVEDVLATHPRVKEVVVVGVAGAADGEERVKAVVVPDGECTDRELIRFCSERLASYKVPEIVEFRDEIPRSPLGSVLRKYLVEE